jgi:ArsR family transcriptional regulator
MKEIMKKADSIANIMKNFSNKDKLAILCFLWNEEKNVTELLSCSTVSQSQISQYLWKMKLEWIVESEKKWKEVFYKISDKKILEIIDSLKIIFTK